MIHLHAADAPASRVAQWHRLDDETVKQIDREILEHKIEQAPKGHATMIGVDEIAHKKGHVYMSVITDMQARRVIALEQGRKASSLGRFFRYLGAEHCRDIEAVVVDRWQPYRAAIRRHCPQALVVFDKFHIIQDCNEAIDKLRRSLQRAMSPEERLWSKHSRWAVLKRPETLTLNQREALRRIEKHNRPLYRAYLLKEQLRQLYAMTPAPGQALQRFVAEMGERFERWFRSVMYSRIPELKKFVRGLRKTKAMVLNYFVHRLTNGLAEGFNSVIRRIQRQACGYRDQAYFALKIYQKAGLVR